jgi:hypothetical protein
MKGGVTGYSLKDRQGYPLSPLFTFERLPILLTNAHLNHCRFLCHPEERGIC